MSHEIRTPMNAVINFTSLILDGAYGPISDELRDAVEEIDRNGEALLSSSTTCWISPRSSGGDEAARGECSPEACVDMAITAQKWKALR